jgi:hypothetical protein
MIAAEFLGAIAICIISPIIEPGPSAAKGGTGPSPYGRQDLVRIGAVFALFFVLALVSKGRPGKMAVAFGALVDLGMLFRASQRGALTGLTAIFKPGSTGTGTAGGGGVSAA